MLKIAIPNKGRLSEPSVQLLKRVGLEIKNGTGERKLFAKTSDPEVEVLFIRAEDIPKYVEIGAADLGITGEDLVLEKGADVMKLLGLDFGGCRIVLAGRKDGNAGVEGKKIATKLPNIARGFLKRKGIQAGILEVRGATEIVPRLGIADFIIDHVSTGATLQQNNLTELETVMESNACLICREDSDKIESIRLMMEGTIAGSKKKYLMMNAKKEDLEKIKKIVPGMRSPTVMPLAEEGECAIHAVVMQDGIADAVRLLKKCGARDILVVGIEQVIE